MIKKMIKYIAPLLILTSCATIIHGTDQAVGICTNPSKAAVWVNGCYTGNTPMVVSLPRNQNHMIHIELEGFEPYDIALTRQLSGWVFGNIVFGGVIGVVIDIASGGIYRLTPDQINAELVTTTYRRSRECSYIGIAMEPKADWEKIGQLKLL